MPTGNAKSSRLVAAPEWQTMTECIIARTTGMYADDSVVKSQVFATLKEWCVLNERDVTTLWRQLFDGQGITDASLAKAKALLNRLSPESPLRLRLATELEEIGQRRQRK